MTTTAISNASPLVKIEGISKYFLQHGTFKSGGHQVKAVDHVDLTLAEGETLGLVGESGSGKSTLGRLILRLMEPSEGRIIFEGENISSLSGKSLLPYRRKMQIVFQDPYDTLNPRMTVARILHEALDLRGVKSSRERHDEVVRLLELVGMRADAAQRFPHQFSGGQRQRIGIARALAVNPKFLVADEPVSALDVSVQAQILNLLLELQKQFGLTMLFVAHDLAVVRHMSDRVAVMYMGRIIELGDNDSVYFKPLHPYTKSLILAIPIPDPNRVPPELPMLTGERPATSGCAYRDRCPLAISKCSTETPELRMIRDQHYVACHRAEEISNGEVVV